MLMCFGVNLFPTQVAPYSVFTLDVNVDVGMVCQNEVTGRIQMMPHWSSNFVNFRIRIMELCRVLFYFFIFVMCNNKYTFKRSGNDRNRGL